VLDLLTPRNVEEVVLYLKETLASTLNLRSLILSGDFFLAAVVACTLTKLVLRLEEVQPSKVEANKACTGALLVMTSILHGHDLHSVGFFYIKQPATVFSLEKREINLFISKTGPKIASG
jgi:hypothetical protein